MWVNVQQNTQEWLDLRLGKITSSNFGTIMANEGKAFGEPAKNYAEKIALEIVTNKRDETDLFTNKLMMRGHELEPIASDLYEIETMQTVTNGGFFDCGKFGGSPDGLVGLNGCIEIKSVIAKTHWKTIKRRSFDPSYKWQIHGHLLVSERYWCDWISFCPEMPESKQLIIHRVERDEEIIERMVVRLTAFSVLVNENVKLLR